MAQILMYIVLAFTFFGLSGCATGVVATGAATTAYVANQEQTLSQQAKDLQIKTRITDSILRQKIGYFKDIEVNVENGEVLLIGVVKSSLENRKLQNIASSQKYVKKIHNRIYVDRNYSFSRYANDALIANMIRTRMVFSKYTYLSKINVEVFRNRVYLVGEVGNKQEKIAAENIARTGKGAQSVYSYIKINKNK